MHCACGFVSSPAFAPVSRQPRKRLAVLWLQLNPFPVTQQGPSVYPQSMQLLIWLPRPETGTPNAVAQEMPGNCEAPSHQFKSLLLSLQATAVASLNELMRPQV